MRQKQIKKQRETTKQRKREGELIQAVAQKVREKLEGEGSGHDWWHIYRVWSTAKELAQKEERSNGLVVELAALLHDIADWKLCDGDETVGPRVAKEILQTLCVDEQIIEHVCSIIKNISFKGVEAESFIETIEGMIVQDADRLDAIGAIGIARCFVYGGYKQILLHRHDIQVTENQSVSDYKKKSITGKGGTCINHFYEKLLLLKERMNTDAARIIAHERHKFMELFLKQFLQEWDGKR